jgi:hypothetical protein
MARYIYDCGNDCCGKSCSCKDGGEKACCWQEVEAPIGQAPETVECPECGKEMKRSWKNLNIAGKVEGGTNGGSKLGRN